MQLLNSTTALLLPALTFTAVLASTVPASSSASPTPIILHSDNVQLVEYWSPISTLTWLASPTNRADLQADLEHDLLRREVVTGAAPAQPTGGSQVSPITTIGLNEIVNGVAQQVQVVYTQLFSAVPDQGFAPASGSIGLGTIQGQIGVVKTARKRDANPRPTEIAYANVERSQTLEEDVVNNAVVLERDEHVQTVERRSLAGKVDANSAGSALALLVAITAMIVV
jgi:Killer toxin-resistance protein 1